MLIICDKRIPARAQETLKSHGRVIPFMTRGLVYDAIAGHPDIFFHAAPAGLIYAPNTPAAFIDILRKENIPLIKGRRPAGPGYPSTAAYNATATANRLIGNIPLLDESLTEAYSGKEKVTVNQGYTACNLLTGPVSMLTSDRGIAKTLGCRYISPEGILLPGFRHGFIGGCCGITEQKLFFTGSLRHYASGHVLRHFATENQLEIVELYDGPPVDGGGILFLKTKS